MTNREKAEKLLKQMTLTEKIGQLVLCAGCNVDDKGVPDSFDLVRLLREGKCGSVIVQPQDMSEAVNFMQKIAVEESRLHIPLFINCDMIHGFETVFPIPLASACSFNTELVKKCAEMSAKEAYACGVRYTNAPMVDVSRDPRWGRIAESQGEDPYLAGEMAKAYVSGYQNRDNYVMSTLKHYAGYGASEGGRDYDIVEVNENTMLNTYLIPFREGVSAGADSVMTGFNALENVPISGNKRYLKDILRDKFGFNGIVISDASSIGEMLSYGVCKDIAECNEKAIEAGVDIDLGGVAYPNGLEKSVLDGKVKESLIDQAVLRVLEKKYELGLFEDPYSKKDKSCVFSANHLELAEELAIESAVLLRNDGNLPIKQDKNISIIGKFALSKDFLGCWQNSSKTEDLNTLEKAFKTAGYSVVGVSSSYDLKETEKAIKNADMVIFTCGEFSEENGEAHSKHNIHLKQEEVDCFNYIKGLAKKTVSLVFAGRPLVVSDIDSGALVYCWDLGHKTADAIVKLISGERNFSGKLAVTIPADEGQLPVYYLKKKLGRPYQPENPEWRFQCRYDDGYTEPEYVFGYGLSYSRFKYKNLKAEKLVFNKGENLDLSIEIENDSDIDGTEIVQLYINDVVSEIIRPIKELKDFKKVKIKAHDTVTVHFSLSEERFKYYHIDGSFSADVGEFIVYVGSDSSVKDCVKIKLVD
ncbi:MAG: glycoside hydrolase family 3 C-terminal domain-containing protein [Clostridia bacterium]|nr:glycoside hydrolase family 3 C-terminal domain-containing protein [Clostridia bacterium]